ncbi:alginate O-acetyltransferase [Pseudomonas soli]|jgi:alginate O-acetyltransferase complex protein AlgJ|uniref:Probable alginate O-acetylase AlgJ n=1 Tax=Pseudomonas soli TaxID=1306993 RepID=A0A1H9NKH0_9PSED|nr:MULTISPECIES: alginate O-acetyltransferase [Pseudomonas]AIN60208.1 alginate O-acetyltransferase [Pseudomonas soli]AUY35785.1 alginate O-acetyltransferase [Pseudomonas sp. PONIH3]MCX5507664.1 alginate O-acetyltransferase [Pseudomonas sp. BJa3]MDT3716524.1 alginate O-acetyltransferase [Pseudomonas soli]MDT3733257.1 alginate O-acetyltransferase [Pseudomonas soli]
MNRTLRITYSLTFMGLLVGLGAWSVGGLESFNRTGQMTLLDGKLAKAAETHYDEQFPIKRVGTNLWAALDFKLFNEGRPGVVLGRDQWLFTDEEFNPTVGAQQQMQDNLALVRGVRDTLQRQGVQLVLAIVPAKARLYSEYIGKETPASLHDDLFNQFHAQARQANVFAPDLLAPLEQAKARGQVFLRTDTHWTPMGAEVVAQSLAEAVDRQHLLTGEPQAYITEAGASAPYKGDLTNFLPLDPLFSNLLPSPDTLQQRKTHPVQAEGAEGGDALFDDSRIPVALVGTSYSANPHWNFLGALQQALRSDVANYAEDGHGPLLPMLKYLQSDAFKNAPPQVVVWEFPERYLPMKNDLSAFDPQWIAQLKNSRKSEENLALSSNRTDH